MAAGGFTDAQEFARILGIDAGTLSRYLSGDRKSCRPQTLAQICLRASRDISMQAHLLAAYLSDQRDQCGGDDFRKVREMVEVAVRNHKTARISEEAEHSMLVSILKTNGIPRALEDAMLLIIKAYSKSKSFRQATLSLAEMAKELK